MIAVRGNANEFCLTVTINRCESKSHFKWILIDGFSKISDIYSFYFRNFYLFEIILQHLQNRIPRTQYDILDVV